MGLAGAVGKLGILVPMSLSLIIWHEYPTVMQWCGICLAIVSIILVNWPSAGSLRGALRPAQLLLFLFCGTAEFSNKVFQKYGLQEHKSLFLLVTFSVAFLLSLAVTIKIKRVVTCRDLLIGVLVGIPNLFSSFFLILALERIMATIAFPAYGAGTIVVINLVGLLFFKEKLERTELTAVALTIAALILINLRKLRRSKVWPSARLCLPDSAENIETKGEFEPRFVILAGPDGCSRGLTHARSLYELVAIVDPRLTPSDKCSRIPPTLVVGFCGRRIFHG